MLKNLIFEASIRPQPKAKFDKNSEFTDCVIDVMYSGKNRNGSKITRESVDEAVSTLYNVPIIGEFIEYKDDFGDHSGELEPDENGDLKYVVKTRPYGVVNESTKISWSYKEVDGELKECFSCTGKLWTGKYPELMTLIENGSKGQSMEITDVEGDTDTDGYFDIKKFKFSALCILGDDVEPCFENSKVEVKTLFTKNKDNKKDFEYMLTKINEKNKEKESEDNDVEKIELKDNEMVVDKTKYSNLEKSAQDLETAKSDLTKSQEDFKKLEQEKEDLAKEIEGLKEFKRQASVEKKVAKYSKHFTAEGLKELNELVKDKSEEDAERIIKDKIVENVEAGTLPSAKEEEQEQDNVDENKEGLPAEQPKTEEFKLGSTRYFI